MASAFLDAYLRRIGVSNVGAPDLSTLRRVHAAHVEAIPFENLDILLGRGVRLDLEHLQRKLIEQRRGGYCFEQNALFLAALGELGYTAVAMEARVRVGTTAMRPRTHMVLGVDVAGEQWLADVGFGGEGPREPVPMQAAAQFTTSRPAYRVIAEGDLRVLQMQSQAQWIDQYAFLPSPAPAIDFEVANWYTSTYPASPFVRTLTAQRVTEAARFVLRYPTLTEIRGHDVRTRDISRTELLPLLRTVFLIDLPDDTVFPAIDTPALSAAET